MNMIQTLIGSKENSKTCIEFHVRSTPGKPLGIHHQESHTKEVIKGPFIVSEQFQKTSSYSRRRCACNGWKDWVSTWEEVKFTEIPDESNVVYNNRKHETSEDPYPCLFHLWVGFSFYVHLYGLLPCNMGTLSWSMSLFQTPNEHI